MGGGRALSYDHEMDLMKTMRRAGPMSVKRLALKLKWGEGTVRAACNQLRADGSAFVASRDINTGAKEWALTEA